VGENGRIKKIESGMRYRRELRGLDMRSPSTRGAHGSKETPESDAGRAEPLERGENLVGAAADRASVEVKYDHLQGDRFRHAAVFR
jgi:hypothetical protein